MSDLVPKIYVACLATYNDGILHGDWIDANQDPDDLRNAINTILANSPIADAEEWAIHAFDEFDGVYMSENIDLKKVSELAGFIVAHGDLGSGLLSELNGDLEEAQHMLDECYHGEYENEEDFAMSYADDTMTIPENLSWYINYKLMARDLFMSDFFFVKINYKIHVFSHN